MFNDWVFPVYGVDKSKFEPIADLKSNEEELNVEGQSLRCNQRGDPLEHNGSAFYEAASQNTKSESVREIFYKLANEEKKHIDILREQYGNLMREGMLKPIEQDEKPVDISRAVITEKIRQEISATGYEAAAISAAMALEEQAVKFYSECASFTDDQVAKELYQWLANWEKTYMVFLSELDRELMESIWYDNKFWPVI